MTQVAHRLIPGTRLPLFEWAGEAAQAGESGTPIVLLHAFPLDHRMWVDTAKLLAANHRVYSPDLPGMGIAAIPAGEISIETAADVVAATVDDAELPPACVVGISMGGYVAMALLERHPHVVAALGLFDTKASADSSEAAQNRLAMAETIIATDSVAPAMPMAEKLLAVSHASDEHTAQVAQLKTWISDQSPEGIAWSQRAMAARPARFDVLRAWQGPALVARGILDEMSTADDAAAMATVLGSEAPVTVPSVGHLPPLQSPGETAGLIAGLLARI